MPYTNITNLGPNYWKVSDEFIGWNTEITLKLKISGSWFQFKLSSPDFYRLSVHGDFPVAIFHRRQTVPR